MFRSKAFTVRRRFSDFLGLYEKLSVKQSHQGCIIPPPPEKSVVGGCPGLSFSFFFKVYMFMCFFYFPFVTLIQINRNDQSEGGNGRPVISRVCGEKKSSSGEASLETNTNKSNNTQCPQELKIWPTSVIYDSHSIPFNTGPFFFIEVQICLWSLQSLV